MKRFYKDVTINNAGAGWEILLDGRAVRTPSKSTLIAPAQNFAEAVAAEWRAQQDLIDPETMPLTQILTTTIDHTIAARDDITANILAYLNTDLVFYRTVEPPVLAARQAAAWDPWVEWLSTRCGAALATTTALAALVQPQAAHDYARGRVAAMDIWRFNITQMTTAISGSLILAIAFADGDLDADGVFNASQVEEQYRSELYNEALHGLDPQLERKQAGIRRDLSALQSVRAMTKEMSSGS